MFPLNDTEINDKKAASYDNRTLIVTYQAVAGQVAALINGS